jgi:hypothetical protein
MTADGVDTYHLVKAAKRYRYVNDKKNANKNIKILKST